MVARICEKGKRGRRHARVTTHEQKEGRSKRRPFFPVDPGSEDPVRFQGTRGCPNVNACEIVVRPAVTVAVPVSARYCSAAGIVQRHVNLPCEKPTTATRPATEHVMVESVGTAPSLQ